MKRLLTVSLLVFYCLFLNAYLSTCFSYELVQVVEDKYLEGKIAQVDFVKSTISVRFIQPNGDSDEITFLITQHTQIVKGGFALSISEFNKGSEAIVKYHETPGSFSPLKADSINVKPLPILGTQY